MPPSQAPGVSIRLQGAYPLEQLDRLIVDLSPLLAVREPAIIEVDLRDLEFVLPSTAALLAAAVGRPVNS